MQRVREFLRDILRQTDLVLLALCCAATAYGLLMIYSATRYMGTLRLVIVQGAGALIGIIMVQLFCWSSLHAPGSSSRKRKKSRKKRRRS